jgi:hypothetical protein
MFQVTRVVALNEQLSVTVKELTVAEVRGWLSEAPPENKEFDLLTDLLTFDGIGIEEVYRFTDLKKEMIEQLPPSYLAKIAVVIKELNTVFFNQYLPELNKLRERLDQQRETSALSNAA